MMSIEQFLIRFTKHRLTWAKCRQTDTCGRQGDRDGISASDKVSTGKYNVFPWTRKLCALTPSPSSVVAIWWPSPFLFQSFAQQKPNDCTRIASHIVYRLRYNIESLLKSLLFWWSIFHFKISVWLFLPAFHHTIKMVCIFFAFMQPSGRQTLSSMRSFSCVPAFIVSSSSSTILLLILSPILSADWKNAGQRTLSTLWLRQKPCDSQTLFSLDVKCLFSSLMCLLRVYFKKVLTLWENKQLNI